MRKEGGAPRASRQEDDMDPNPNDEGGEIVQRLQDQIRRGRYRPDYGKVAERFLLREFGLVHANRAQRVNE